MQVCVYELHKLNSRYCFYTRIYSITNTSVCFYVPTNCTTCPLKSSLVLNYQGNNYFYFILLEFVLFLRLIRAINNNSAKTKSYSMYYKIDIKLICCFNNYFLDSHTMFSAFFSCKLRQRM